MRAEPTRRTLLAAFGTLALGSTALAALAASGPRTVDIVAKKFEFVPAEIRVERGETVTLRFTAPEVPMGVNLPDFKQRTDIVPGQPATLVFTAEQPGSFAFVCDLFCGTGHEDMSGVVVVT